MIDKYEPIFAGTSGASVRADIVFRDSFGRGRGAIRIRAFHLVVLGVYPLEWMLRVLAMWAMKNSHEGLMLSQNKV